MTIRITMAGLLAAVLGCGGEDKGGAGGAGGAAGDTFELQAEESVFELEATLEETNAAVDFVENDLAVSVPEGKPAAEAQVPERGHLDRADLARWVRQLARGALPCQPPPTVTKAMGMTACGFPYVQQLDVAFAGCTSPRGLAATGTVRVTSDVSLAMGATCERGSLSVNITHDLSLDLELGHAGGARTVIRGTSHTSGQRGRNANPERAITLDVARQRFGADGAAQLDQRFTGMSQTRRTLEGLITNGTHTAELKLLGATITTTVTDVRRTLACCYPVGGSVEVTFERAGTRKQKRVTFGPSCGEATADGTAQTLPACG